MATTDRLLYISSDGLVRQLGFDPTAADLGGAAGVASSTHSATSKTTPVDADEIPMADSAASWGLKKLTWANLKATLATWIGGGTIAGGFTTLSTTGNATLGDAEATDTHAIKGATTVLANSANPAVKITQTGAGNAFVVEDSASTDSTPFVIDSEGRIGQAAIDTRAMHNIGQHAATGSGLQYYRAGGTHPETGTAYTITFHSEVTTPASASTFTELTAFKSQPAATGANSTITLHQGFAALGPTLGAGASITTQYGFAASGSLTAATNNYGFYGNIAAGTGRYNFYAAGDAPNRFVGETLVIGPAGLGYGTGAGGTVTQTTSRTTGVTLSKPTGSITLVSAAGSATAASFTVTNTLVAATDTIIISQKSGTDLYEIHISAVAAGSFRVTFKTTGGTTTEQPVFNFAVIKGVTS